MTRLQGILFKKKFDGMISNNNIILEQAYQTCIYRTVFVNNATKGEYRNFTITNILDDATINFTLRIEKHCFRVSKKLVLESRLDRVLMKTIGKD